MKTIICKGIVGVLVSILVLSCKKDNTTTTSSSSSGSADSGGSTSSTVTARYTQNATLEDYTASWCGWCPRAKTYTDAAVAQYGANVIPMEFHNTDALTPVGEPTLETAFSVTGYPSQYLNRNIPYNASLSQIAPLVTATSSVSSTVGLAINSSLNGTSLSITVKSRFAQAVSGAKLVVYVLENGIVASHANDYSGSSAYSNSSNPLYVWYMDPNPIPNYINDHVVRTSASAILGDAIPTQAGASEYDKVYTVSVPATWNSSNLSIVAMVVQANNNLLNAQQAKVGQVQNFQILVP